MSASRINPLSVQFGANANTRVHWRAFQRDHSSSAGPKLGMAGQESRLEKSFYIELHQDIVSRILNELTVFLFLLDFLFSFWLK